MNKKYLIYIFIIGWIISSCDNPISVLKKVVEPLPPPSMDSTLILGDFRFMNTQDSNNLQIAPILKQN